MKRFILALLLLLLICISVSAENTGRSWFYDGDSIFYFNLDNDTELPLPTYETRYDSEGYKKGKNILSNAGCENTDHIIKYTVRCENYFVSQSDTMKKRPVSIAIIPRVNAGGDTNYCADPRDGAVQPQLTDYVQNTANENFEASFYSPKTNGTVYYHNTDDGKQGYISRFWIDLIIVMPVLTDVERASLITADDYLLNITVTWTCNEPGCDDEDHCGFVSFYIRGAYNTAVPQDTAYMFVEQLPEASALNLTEMTTLQGKLTPTIADMDIYIVVAHKADVLNVVAHAVVGKRQAKLQPGGGMVVNHCGGLHIGRNLGLARQQHSVNRQRQFACHVELVRHFPLRLSADAVLNQSGGKLVARPLVQVERRGLLLPRVLPIFQGSRSATGRARAVR